MTGTADHNDVFGEFACWAVRKAESPMPELVIRGALVARLLGEAADVTGPLRLPELNLPPVKPGELGTLEPLPDELAALVEQQVKRRHAPARWTEPGSDGTDETIYTLPSWLHGAPGTVRSGPFNERPAPARMLRVRLHGEGPQVTVEDALSGEALEGPALRAIPNAAQEALEASAAAHGGSGWTVARRTRGNLGNAADRYRLAAANGGRAQGCRAQGASDLERLR